MRNVLSNAVLGLTAASAFLLNSAPAVTAHSLLEENEGSQDRGGDCEKGINFLGTGLTPLEDILPVPPLGMGLEINPDIGLGMEELAPDVYVITEGVYTSMFVVTDDGVVLFDAPPTTAPNINAAIASVTDKEVTHLVYSHFHADHLSGQPALNLTDDVVRIASEATNAILEPLEDPNRPLADITFEKELKVTIGGVAMEFSLAPGHHTDGDIYMFLPEKKVAMIVDTLFVGYIPFRGFALSNDVFRYRQQIREALQLDADYYVTGHLNRAGDRADLIRSLQYADDVFKAAADAIAADIGVEELYEELFVSTGGNAWLFQNQLDQIRAEMCFEQVLPKYGGLLGGFDVFTRAHCILAMNFLQFE